MKHRAATVMVVVSIQAHPLKHAISRVVHHASVIQTGKQDVQLFRERYTEDMMAVQQSTRITDSSMCIKHIINPM
jgi:hypothetical protein